MAKATVVFIKLIPDAPDCGSDDKHMVSRAFFNIYINGTSTPNIYVDIKQPVDSAFETAPLEISHPHGYKGPFNEVAFRQAAEAYYRGLAGDSETGVRVLGGSNIHNRKSTFIKMAVYEFEVD
ncbi:MAG TPA: hypothetical protein VM553_00120 [Dongiaceae bacterium]|nr:hypothetical protein [Dongiaceae bacterium]